MAARKEARRPELVGEDIVGLIGCALSENGRLKAQIMDRG